MNTFSTIYVPAVRNVEYSLLFLPGLWSSTNVWKKWMNIAARNDCQSWSLELQPKKENTSLASYINLVLNFLNHLEQAHDVQPIIIGHSMAGLVAQIVAEQKQMSKLILLNSAAPVGISNFSLDLSLRTIPYLKKIMTNQLFLPSFKHAKKLLFNNLVADDAKKYYQKLIPDSGRVAREIVFGTFSVDNTHCPTLIIGSSQDKMLPPRIQRKLAVKYSTPYQEFNHGHMTMLEKNSDIVLNHILNWIKQEP